MCWFPLEVVGSGPCGIFPTAKKGAPVERQVEEPRRASSSYFPQLAMVTSSGHIFPCFFAMLGQTADERDLKFKFGFLEGSAWHAFAT